MDKEVDEEEEEEEKVVEGMNVHLSEDKEVISVRSQQLSIVALMRLSTANIGQRTVQCNTIEHIGYCRALKKHIIEMYCTQSVPVWRIAIF